MIVPLKTFTGEFPRTNSYLIQDNAAQQAIDCDFLAGSLRGIASRDPVAGVSGTNIKSLFVYDGLAGTRTYWWTRDVDAVRSPGVNDKYARFYWADDTGFYVSKGTVGGNAEPSSTNKYRVGVPAPTTAPTLNLTGTVFNFNGYFPTSFTAYCEKLDGTLDGEHALGTIANDTYTGVRKENNAYDLFRVGATYAISCPVGLTIADADTNPDTNWSADAGGQVLVNNNVNTLEKYQLLEYVGYKDATGALKTTLAVYYDKDLTVVPSSIRVYNYNTTDAMWQPIPGNFVRSGSTRWYLYSEDPAFPYATFAPPTTDAAGTTTPVGNAGPACVVTFTNKAGNTVKATLRSDGNKSTLPAELPGLGGAIAVNGDDWDISFWLKPDFVVRRVYTYTYVNSYLEEGPPAPPFEFDCGENATVSVGYTPPPEQGFVPITKIRLYRAVGSSGLFLYVGEAPINTSAPYTKDEVFDSALGHTLDTMNFFPPYVLTTDADGKLTGVDVTKTLRGICVMSNGIMAGFRENEVWFSEPYLPYAWNPSAIKPFPHKVVGICPFEGGLYVTTTAEPYIVQGAAPEYMTDMKVAAIQAGVSKGSITNYNGQVVYASHDGLVMMQGAQASLDMSFKFFSRKDWQDLYGDKLPLMRLNVHDGSLVVWFTDGTPGFLLRFEEENPSLTKLSEPIYAGFVHPEADAFYISNGNNVFAFRAGAARNPFSWWSKDFTTPKPTNFGAIQLVGTGTVTVSVYADDVLKHTAIASMTEYGRAIVRLPGGFLARRWSFKIVGLGEVQEFTFANTVGEMQGV